MILSRDHKKIFFYVTENDKVWLKWHLGETCDKAMFIYEENHSKKMEMHEWPSNN